MSDTPERVWVAFSRKDFGRNPKDLGSSSYLGDACDGPDDCDAQYIRKDASDALVTAERERCAVLCEETEMGVPMKSSDADCGTYASMRRLENAAGIHAGMGYAALIRKDGK